MEFRVASLKFAALSEAKLLFLMKLLPNDMPEPEKERYVRVVAEADPTENKSYTTWLLHQARRGIIRLPEDQDRVRDVLSFFDKAKQRWEYGKDIFRFDFNSLEDAVDKVRGTRFEEETDILKSNREKKREIKNQGFQVVYDNPPYAVIKLTTPEACEIMGKGTNWCTKHPEVAQKEYLPRGALYVLLKNNKKIAQFHLPSRQFRNIRDKMIEIKPAWAKILAEVMSNEQQLSPMDALSLYQLLHTLTPKQYQIILSDPKIALLYAKLSQEDTPELRRAISASPIWAAIFARDVLGKRWPEQEPNILADVTARHIYRKLLNRGKPK